MADIIKYTKGNYEITISGSNVAVFSFHRKRYLTCMINKSGYLSFALQSKNVPAHRLVAEYFLGELPKGLCVNHKDGYKFNNDISNLEYVTISENIKHSYRTGLHTIAKDRKNAPKYIDGRCDDVVKYKSDWYLKNRERILKKLKDNYKSVSK